MECDFRFYFKYGKWDKQYVDVYLWDVHPNTFARWDAGRWGYFLPTWKNPKSGLFGELHFVKGRLRFDTIVHELDHLWIEWMWANGETITRRNEERMIEKVKDRITKSFRNELRKKEPKIKL